MRNGQLLAEESPMQLMIKHNCSNLEQAFLELSKKQCTSTIGQEDENCVSMRMVSHIPFMLPAGATRCDIIFSLLTV